MKVLVFETMTVDGDLYTNPYTIDPETLKTCEELNLWLKSIYIIESNLLELLGQVRWSAFMSYDIPKSELDNSLFGFLFEDKDREEIRKLYDVLSHSGYGDVFGKDRVFLSGRSKGYAHVLVKDGRYLGHVYSWLEGKSLAVQGIRTSLINFIYRYFKLDAEYGVAKYIIASTLSLAREKNLDLVIVIEPIKKMPEILTKLGFRVFELMPGIRYYYISSTAIIETDNDFQVLITEC